MITVLLKQAPGMKISFLGGQNLEIVPKKKKITVAIGYLELQKWMDKVHVITGIG